jgi:hypothetical protein
MWVGRLTCSPADAQPHGSSFFGNRGRIDAVAHAADQTATFGQSGGMARVGGHSDI